MSQIKEYDEDEFFRLIHDILDGDAAAERVRDKRRRRREPFPSRQLVAPRIVGQTLAQADFAEVRCVDLSTAGFSFLATQPQDHRSLLVALGSAPNWTYVAAEVMHETPMTLVGCQFTRRMD